MQAIVKNFTFTGAGGGGGEIIRLFIVFGSSWGCDDVSKVIFTYECLRHTLRRIFFNFTPVGVPGVARVT